MGLHVTTDRQPTERKTAQAPNRPSPDLDPHMKRPFFRGFDVWDLLMLVGGGFVVYGMFIIFEPAGWITAGAGMCWLGLLMGKS